MKLNYSCNEIRTKVCYSGCIDKHLCERRRICLKLLAHITNYNNERKEQSLKEHCKSVAEYASGCVSSNRLGSIGFFNMAYLAGILHDCGKAKKEFNDYLEEAYEGKSVKKGSVNHTFAGVIYLLEKYHKKDSSQWDKLTSEIVSFVIGSHHGMFDCDNFNNNNGFEHRLECDKENIHYSEACDNFFSQIVQEDKVEKYFSKAAEEIQSFFKICTGTYHRKSNEVFFQISMLIRLLLSAVIYGDRRDTREFMKQNREIESEVNWKEYQDFFEEKLKKITIHSESELDCIRKKISDQCRQFAERSCGIYRLNVPTGGGKTLSSMRYALTHAEKYQKKRIIFIIPLLSVLDQNIKVIRDFVPKPESVLEHHSNVVKEHMENEELDRFEYLTDSWNAPIVVSTLVQLLDILFSDKTSAIGRMQALCDSIIVIDEIQSLPKKTTVMFNMALNFLQQFCNATIILSSATQPCFEELKWPLHLTKEPDMVQLKEEELQVFNRAEVIDKVDGYGYDIDECVDFCRELMQNTGSLLVICNTKSEAYILSQKLQSKADDEAWSIYHLSTAMCQKHRLNVLNSLQKDLKLAQEVESNDRKNKVICISTQLIEAGIDISFQSVVRIMAGIDNLAQAAGRCNRSNEYGNKGKVYLIKWKNENLAMLQDIEKARNSTQRVLEEMKSSRESLISEMATSKFYKHLYKEIEKEIKYPASDEYKTEFYLADCLSNKYRINEKYLLQQPFKTVGRIFQVFNQVTFDVLVPYDEGENLIQQIYNMEQKKYNLPDLEKILQNAKQYTVSLYKWQIEKLKDAGLLTLVFDDRILILGEEGYDKKYGVIMNEEQSVENFII